jgi:hypothetical protein
MNLVMDTFRNPLLSARALALALMALALSGCNISVGNSDPNDGPGPAHNFKVSPEWACPGSPVLLKWSTDSRNSVRVFNETTGEEFPASHSGSATGDVWESTVYVIQVTSPNGSTRTTRKTVHMVTASSITVGGLSTTAQLECPWNVSVNLTTQDTSEYDSRLTVKGVFKVGDSRRAYGVGLNGTGVDLLPGVTSTDAFQGRSFAGKWAITTVRDGDCHRDAVEVQVACPSP